MFGRQEKTSNEPTTNSDASPVCQDSANVVSPTTATFVLEPASTASGVWVCDVRFTPKHDTPRNPMSVFQFVASLYEKGEDAVETLERDASMGADPLFAQAVPTTASAIPTIETNAQPVRAFANRLIPDNDTLTDRVEDVGDELARVELAVHDGAYERFPAHLETTVQSLEMAINRFKRMLATVAAGDELSHARNDTDVIRVHGLATKRNLERAERIFVDEIRARYVSGSKLLLLRFG